MSDNDSPGLSSLLLKPLTPAPLALPPLNRLRKAIDHILDRADAPRGPLADTEKVFALMLERITQAQWRRTPLTLVTRAAALAFNSEHRDRPDLAILRHFLLAEIPASTRAGFLNPMVRVYVETYAPHAPHTRALASALSLASHRLGDQWQHLLKRFPNFFDSEKAPDEIGVRMATMDEPWSGLRELGFRNPHAPGLLDAAHFAYLGAIGTKLHERREIEKLLGWLRPKDDLKRVKGTAEAVTALIRPWIHNDPPDDIKKLIVDGVTRLYGHPRAGQREVWGYVHGECLKPLIRWITGLQLELILNVLTEANEGHMWAPRHKFWREQFNNGKISDAWVAFNPVGYKIATKKLTDPNKPGVRMFGFQNSTKNDDGQKSLLIMKIGKWIVVEGTWSFKIHMFNADDPRAPKLGEPKFNADDIRALPNSESRVHDIHGHWTKWVLDRI